MAQHAIALDDSQPDAYQALSFFYRLKQQPEQALAEGERAVTLDPNYADSYANLSEILVSVGKAQDAIEMAQKAIRLNPRGPAWYLPDLGSAYLSAGRVEEATAILKQGLMRDPNLQLAYVSLAWSYVWQWLWQLRLDPQLLEQAFDAVQKALALNDSLPSAHVTLGTVYLLRKQPEQARAEAERALAIDPNLADGYALLAKILNTVGNPVEAIGEAEKAVRLGSPNPVYLFDLGHAYYLSGRYEEAIVTLKKFTSNNPNILHAQLVLAIAASEAGREADARAAATEVLRISPNFSLAVMREREPHTDPAVIERRVVALHKAGLK